MLLFSFRNVFRNKRRTFITFFSVVFGTLLITFVRFMAYGIHQESLMSAVELSPGFMQLAAYGWLENKPVERALDITPGLLESLKVDGVSDISLRIEAHALAGHENNSEFVSVFAADPEIEKRLTTLHKKPIKGKYLFETGSDSVPVTLPGGSRIKKFNVIMGEVLANNLDVKQGDEISLVTSQFDGSVGAILGNVVGIYKTYDVELDSMRIYMPLSAGEKLFGLGPVDGEYLAEGNYEGKKLMRYTNIALGVDNYLKAEEVYANLHKKFPGPQIDDGLLPEDSFHYDPVLHFWPELIPGLYEILEFDDYQNEFSWAFIIIVIAFGVMNTVQMSIHERTREFGVLMAIGTKPHQLIYSVLIEMIIILLPGLILGSLGGIALGNYFHENPIPLSTEFHESYASMGFDMPHIKPIVNLTQLWIGVSLLFFPSIILTVLAARRVFKIEPVKAIAEY